MRGEAQPQLALSSYVSLEERIPRDHPLRQLRVLVDAMLAMMAAHFWAAYAKRGRPSILAEFLLRPSLIQILYAVHSERQLVEQIVGVRPATFFPPCRDRMIAAGRINARGE
jgi:transposase